MRQIFILCFTLSSVLFIFSCKDKEKESQLAQINTLENTLDSLALLANEHRIDTLGALIQHIKTETKKFSSLYYPDTIDLKIAGMMNSYKQARKAMSSNSGNLAKVNQSIPEVQQKLKDLTHDIENGVGQRDKYQEHIRFEVGKVEQIKNILDFYILNKLKYDSIFRVNDERVRLMIEELNNEE